MTTRQAPRSLRITPPPVRRRRRGVVRVVAVTLGTLLLATLLAAESLVRTAEHRPFGWQRDVAVAVTQPMLEASRTLRLDLPRTWLEGFLGRGKDAVGPDPGATAAPVPTPGGTAMPAPDPAPSRAPSPRPSPSSAPTASPEPSTALPAEPTPASRVATPDAPAAMLVAGDSLTESLGPSLANLALASGVLEPDHELRYSSGLTRRDFFDWPAHLTHVLGQRPADIVVVMVGGNDAQAIETASGWIGFGEPGWTDEYRRRVDEAMTVLEAGADTVYWVGMPIARSADFRARMRVLNDAYREVADAHPDVRYVSSWELFATADGEYSDWLPDEDGEPTLVRRTDGIHLTPTGGDWLADHVLSVIEQDWSLAP